MRPFIAINFPDDIKDVIYKTAMELKERCISGNFSKRENLHLTLMFLGEASREQAERIKKALGSVSFKDFDISLRGLGKFRRGKECLYWLGIDNERALGTLAEAVRSAVGRIFVPEDKKAFSPHVTIARRAVPKAELNETAFSSGMQKASFTVGRISLMRSDRMDDKLVYTEIFGKNSDDRTV